MSVHVSSYVWKNCHMSVAQKLVMLKLADNSNDDGYCYPAIATIASECCMSERYVQKIIKQLIASGELRVDVQSGKKTPNGYTNVYYMLKYREMNAITATPSDLRATGEQSDTPISDGVNNSTPQNSEGVNNSTPHGVNNSTPKPSKEQTTTTPPATRKPVQDEKQKAPVEPVKEPKKQPVNEVAEAIKHRFSIYATNYQIAHIIQGTYKATSSKSRQSDRTATWVALAEKFAQRPATVADIEAFAAWYRSKCSYNMKSTDTFLNYYGEWFDMRKAQVAAQPALRMYKGELDPYGIIEALDRERMEKAAAQEKSA